MASPQNPKTPTKTTAKSSESCELHLQILAALFGEILLGASNDLDLHLATVRQSLRKNWPCICDQSTAGVTQLQSRTRVGFPRPLRVLALLFTPAWRRVFPPVCQLLHRFHLRYPCQYRTQHLWYWIMGDLLSRGLSKLTLHVRSFSFLFLGFNYRNYIAD